jgi:hypothetical protein
LNLLEVEISNVLNMSKLPPRPATGAQRKGLNKENLDDLKS